MFSCASLTFESLTSERNEGGGGRGGATVEKLEAKPHARDSSSLKKFSAVC